MQQSATHREGRVRNKLPWVRRLGAMGAGWQRMREHKANINRKHGHLAGGCAEQNAHASLSQAGEGLLKRVFADAVEHSVHTSTT